MHAVGGLRGRVAMMENEADDMPGLGPDEGDEEGEKGNEEGPIGVGDGESPPKHGAVGPVCPEANMYGIC